MMSSARTGLNEQLSGTENITINFLPKTFQFRSFHRSSKFFLYFMATCNLYLTSKTIIALKHVKSSCCGVVSRITTWENYFCTHLISIKWMFFCRVPFRVSIFISIFLCSKVSFHDVIVAVGQRIRNIKSERSQNEEEECNCSFVYRMFGTVLKLSQVRSKKTVTSFRKLWCLKLKWNFWV